jgi:ABC-type dipeptide/oligopeptide/nickel transport system permease subunit
MATKVILRLLIFVLVLTTFIERPVWRETDCCKEKDDVLFECKKKNPLKLGTDYVGMSLQAPLVAGSWDNLIGLVSAVSSVSKRKASSTCKPMPQAGAGRNSLWK